MSKYFCSKCNGYHYKGKKFDEHKEFEVNISKSEVFKTKFRKSWKRYSIKSHQKTYGNRKQ